MSNTIPADRLNALRQLDTCTVSNAIEVFDVRLRNEGFSNAAIRCMFEHLPPMLGYAVTAKVRSSSPPPVGHTYYDRTDWWNYIVTLPAPRVVVMQDVDSRPGMGSLLGAVHANILSALGCAGLVTNGAVRDLQEIEKIPFQVFAAHPAVSHAYVHIVDFGSPVEVGGLSIKTGDLVHGDRHGIQTIPIEIAARIPAVAARMIANEQKIIELCRSPQFSLSALRAAVKKLEVSSAVEESTGC
jgi:regulator of RNase E activity RraA